jgi:hypothetical protein
MKYAEMDVEIKDSVADGTVAATMDMIHKTFHVFSDDFAGKVQVQGSQNGSNFYNIGSEITAPGTPGWAAKVAVDDTVKFVRASTTLYTAGTATGKLAGIDARGF